MKIQAIAEYLNIATQEIKRVDSNTFVVNERIEKVGVSPDYYVGSISNLKKSLEQYPKLIKKITDFLKCDYTDRSTGMQIYREARDKTTTINTLYTLVAGVSIDENIQKDFVNAWLERKVKDRRIEKTVNDGKYLVLTDKQSNDFVRQKINEELNELLPIELGERRPLRTYFDEFSYANDTIDSIGRGGVLATDNKEGNIKIKNKEYYIYKI